jgi:hypothetical protein
MGLTLPKFRSTLPRARAHPSPRPNPSAPLVDPDQIEGNPESLATDVAFVVRAMAPVLAGMARLEGVSHERVVFVGDEYVEPRPDELRHYRGVVFEWAWFTAYVAALVSAAYDRTGLTRDEVLARCVEYTESFDEEFTRRAREALPPTPDARALKVGYWIGEMGPGAAPERVLEAMMAVLQSAARHSLEGYAQPRMRVLPERVEAAWMDVLRGGGPSLAGVEKSLLSARRQILALPSESISLRLEWEQGASLVSEAFWNAHKRPLFRCELMSPELRRVFVVDWAQLGGEWGTSDARDLGRDELRAVRNLRARWRDGAGENARAAGARGTGPGSDYETFVAAYLDAAEREQRRLR